MPSGIAGGSGDIRKALTAELFVERFDLRLKSRSVLFSVGSKVTDLTQTACASAKHVPVHKASGQRIMDRNPERVARRPIVDGLPQGLQPAGDIECFFLSQGPADCESCTPAQSSNLTVDMTMRLWRELKSCGAVLE